MYINLLLSICVRFLWANQAGVAQLLQQGANTSLQRGESEFQILKRMMGKVKGASVAWDSIKAEIVKTKPSCQESTPYMLLHSFRCLFVLMAPHETKLFCDRLVL